RLLAPLLTDPAQVSIVPGNHDRTTGRSFRSRRFEGTFGAFMPALTFPWLRRLDSETAILGLDPTRTRFSPRGKLPADQLVAAQAMTSNPDTRPKLLIVACHYPVAAPVRYQRAFPQAAGQRSGHSLLARRDRPAPLLLWTCARSLGVPAAIAAKPDLSQRRRPPDARPDRPATSRIP